MNEAHQKYLEWLEALQPGDPVVVQIPYASGYTYKTTEVVRITGTQILTGPAFHPGRYRKKNGYHVGTSYGPRMVPRTDKILKAIQVEKNKTAFDRLTHRGTEPTDDEIAVMLDALRNFREHGPENSLVSDLKRQLVEAKDDARGKRCTECSGPTVAYSSIQHPEFNKLGYRECADCKSVFPWHLDDGQQPLIGSHRQPKDRV